MTTSRPFPCKQCAFCNEAFRIDGGGGGSDSGVDSIDMHAWFCSGGCYNMARLFGEDNGTFNQAMKHNLIETFNRVYINENGDNIPKINREKVNYEVDRGEIRIVKGLYEPEENYSSFRYND